MCYFTSFRVFYNRNFISFIKILIILYKTICKLKIFSSIGIFNYISY